MQQWSRYDEHWSQHITEPSAFIPVHAICYYDLKCNLLIADRPSLENANMTSPLIYLLTYKLCRSYQSGTNRYNSFGEMMRPWVSYLLFNFLCLTFPYFCQEDYLSNPRVWTIAYGFTFSNIVVSLLFWI